jgi:hypothetical protein
LGDEKGEKGIIKAWNELGLPVVTIARLPNDWLG